MQRAEHHSCSDQQAGHDGESEYVIGLHGVLSRLFGHRVGAGRVESILMNCCSAANLAARMLPSVLACALPGPSLPVRRQRLPPPRALKPPLTGVV
jgi:hypothetical protein